MARPASGEQHVAAARALLKSAKTADELRLAQAVLLPVELGLSLEQTAACIGRSVGATCTMRTRFGKVAEGKMLAPRSKSALRNRAHADLAQEAQALDVVMAGANQGGIVVIPRIQQSLQAQLGKKLALSTVYRMLARHGWRKLAPDTSHPQGDPAAREEWKKNSAPTWVKSPPTLRTSDH
jgi:transposase